eukprot:TRINITY_DN482_c0_g1_i1.p1 TRINITY_DN482_c0_g1~~TRINITY_DN482_c0_g1_i1.p1  ORF type:complete len:139 (+),score=3.31 TRINITY_DN482_c0_g1_i1:39-455(+)
MNNTLRNKGALRNLILNQYKEMLKISLVWCDIYKRNDRSAISHSLKDHISHRYRNNINKIEQQQELYNTGEKEYVSLKKLVKNINHNKYYRGAQEIPEVAKNADKLLSSQSQKKVQKNRWGYIERLVGFFYSNNTNKK